jgi:plastocyanin
MWTVGMAATAIVALALLLAGSPKIAANTQQPATTEVKIDNFSFGPGTLTVAVGTTITWTNRDDIPHTVVSTDGVFKSKVLDTDEKFSFISRWITVVVSAHRMAPSPRYSAPGWPRRRRFRWPLAVQLGWVNRRNLDCHFRQHINGGRQFSES